MAQGLASELDFKLSLHLLVSDDKQPLGEALASTTQTGGWYPGTNPTLGKGIGPPGW